MLTTSLATPADKRFLPMAKAYARELAVAAGLSGDDVLALELAMEEGFMNIAEHAYPDGTPGEVAIEGVIDAAELVLSLRDEGVPFDSPFAPLCDQAKGAAPEEAPACAASAASPSPEAALSCGLGLRLIRFAVDEACFVNLGKRGKELRLVKHLPHPLDAMAEPPPDKVEPAPPQHYDIRPMRPEEALDVARVFWLAYGYSYKNEDLYRPEGLMRLVGGGKLVSLVAVAEDGSVVGHAGLLRPEPVPMAEAALLAVAPAHRGRGLMEALGEAMEAKARELGLMGASSNAVTSHAVTQRELARHGGVVCGLNLAASEPRRFKAISDPALVPQRESTLFFFRLLAAPTPALVHVPLRHRPVLKKIYAALGRPVAFGWPGPADPAQGPGQHQVRFHRGLNIGEISVKRAEETQWPLIRRSADDLAAIANAALVTLDLPLAQPASALLCDLAEAAGFFFSGLHPFEAPDGDILRLQRLNTPLDFDRLRIYPPLGKELLAYVRAEKERVEKTEGKTL